MPPFAADLARRQPFAAGSVDRLLLEQQVLLTRESRPRLYGGRPADRGEGEEERPLLAAILQRIAPAGSLPLASLVALTRWCHRIPRDYPTPEGSTATGYYGDFRAYFWGGSEEEIIAKGSPWPQELSRALATLLRLAGLPSRLVFLYRDDRDGRSGLPALHTVVEAWVVGGWAVCDAVANRCYVWPHHGYASAADLQQQPWLVDRSPEYGHNPYVASAYYKTVAIGHYPLDDPGAHAHAHAYDLQTARREDTVPLETAARVFST